MTEQSTDGIDRKGILHALDRLAIGFESADPHIRHESKMVARQNISQIARECSAYTDTEQSSTEKE